MQNHVHTGFQPGHLPRLFGNNTAHSSAKQPIMRAVSCMPLQCSNLLELTDHDYA